MEITQEKNLKNMEKRPRFISCPAPKCPLDFFISERVELPEDERCPALIKHRRKSEKGSRLGRLRGVIRGLIGEKNKVSDKTTNKTATPKAE